MNAAVTEGIRISVETIYRPDYSSFNEGLFLFSYHITIENNSTRSVQLLERHWNIFDIHLKLRTIEGSGVVGQQPILLPSEQYSYSSACDFKSGIGWMKGFFTMKDIDDENIFKVTIPKFELYATHILN